MTDKPDVAELVERLRKLQSTAYGTVRMLQDKRKLVVNNHVVADTTGDTTIEFATALLQNAPVILDALTTLSRRNAELEAENANLLLQAQGHVMEARTANATITEIYQVVTGKTGEPGNWYGAQPVIKRLAELEADNARMREALGSIAGIVDAAGDATKFGFRGLRNAQRIARAALGGSTDDKA